jgi:hypothetical protein
MSAHKDRLSGRPACSRAAAWLAIAITLTACRPTVATYAPDGAASDPATTEVWISRADAKGFHLDIEDVEVMLPKNVAIRDAQKGRRRDASAR